MSFVDEGVVVLYTHIEMAIAKYGNKCSTKHKAHKTSPKRLDLLFFTKYDLVTLTFDLMSSFCMSTMSIIGYIICNSVVKESNNCIDKPPPQNQFS